MLENRLIMAESSKLVMFAVQTAAAVLEAVKTMPKYNEVPKSGIGGTLAEHVNMAPLGLCPCLADTSGISLRYRSVSN